MANPRGSMDDIQISITAEISQLEKSLADANKRLADHEKKLGVTSDRATQHYKRMGQALDPVTRAEMRWKQAIDARDVAVKKGVKDLTQYDRAVTYHKAQLDDLASRYDSTTGRLRKLSAFASTRGLGSMRAFGQGIQQAGYQVGDFAVQVASGQGFLRPFIQQGTQLVSMFGPKGAVIGALGAIAGAVATYFSTASDAAEKATDSTRGFTEKLAAFRYGSVGYSSVTKDVTKSLEDYVDSLKEALSVEKERDRLRSKVSGEFESSEIENLKEALVLAKERRDIIAKRYKSGDDSFLGSIGITSSTKDELYAAQDAVSKLFIALRRLRNATPERDLLKAEVSANITNDRTDAMMGLVKQYRAGKITLEEYNNQLEISNALLELSEGGRTPAPGEADIVRDALKRKQEADKAFSDASALRAIDRINKQTAAQAALVAQYSNGQITVEAYSRELSVQNALLGLSEEATQAERDALEASIRAKQEADKAFSDASALRAIDRINKQTAATKVLVKQYADGALDIKRYNNELEVQNALLGLSEEATQAERDALEASIRAKQDVTKEFKRVNEVANLSERMFNKAGDALADFVMNGKSDFKSLINSMISDLIRYQIQQSMVEPLVGAGGFSGIFSSIGSFFGGSSAPVTTLAPIRMEANPHAWGMADGGPVQGRGGPRTDSVPAMLSNGEFVVNAQATKQNRMLLEAINSGSVIRRFEAGGSVTPPPAANMNGNGTIVNIVDQRTNQSEPVEMQQRTRSDGRREISVLIRDTVRRGIVSGEYDKSMEQRFGSSPALTRRG